MSTNSMEERLLALSDLSKVGRYEIVRKLGQGGASLVFLGRDPYIKRLVALKLAPLASSGVSDKFFKEIQSTGRMTHPNIVAVYDAGLARDYCYIAMEYVDGPQLSEFCKPGRLMPLANAVECIYKVVRAIGYAHEKGIVHRDLKPSNIIMEDTKTPKISDFGIAVVTEETAPLEQAGTPSYMSPEQLRDETCCPQSDIYALGCVLYELLTGQKAFDGDSFFSIMYKVINEEPVGIRALNPDLPPILEKIVGKAMAKDKLYRYSSCEEFAFELKVALRGLSAPAKLAKNNDVVEYVQSVSFFAEFSKIHVRELMRASEMVQVKDGECIVEEGEIDDSFYIVLSGATKVIRRGNKVATIGIGECFGEMAYIGGRPRSASVISEGDCILMKINGALLDRAPAKIQLLFFKQFALTLVNRLSRSSFDPKACLESVV
ncbi:cyclic nucleotide-binding protein [Desulfatibacillum aliphaticivorans]|uniref:Cyclic nucleotide-binding protein n=1 Tax=Desulfatibacillum aliphaticivorans TaxID=218208 RepID=B8FFB2_DESAL|nr:serine/threonine-protein kinase [Desulfatibacillum aliphaticivorans]ACL04172.1 cyclic nucleotide-binding protein [Desulfatibacillum aliphaticivorans]